MLPSSSPGFGFQFPDFYDREELVRLDASFLAFLEARDAELHRRLLAARAAPDTLVGKPESELLLALAPELEDFIGELFGVAPELAELRQRHGALAPLYTVKRLFVQRRAAKKFPPNEAAAFNADGALSREVEALIGGEITELRFATQVDRWMQAEAEHAAALDTAARYAAWATHTPDGQRAHKGGVLFKIPHKVDPLHLVPVETEVVDGVTMLKLPDAHRRARDGFGLTDPGTDLTGALDHANYCIWCHNQGKDSCSKGLREKSGEFKKSQFGVVLAGCPLDEKISEMNLAESEGHTLGALAIAIVDNPMCAATGHRICNDCMKACIYQKQEPVDIPQVETRVLKDVLALPYGFEIYSLLTRWNPLNIRRPLPRPATSRKVLVVGLGPAGFTLAHHLMNDGHAVVAIDGLKIEPLPADISGVEPTGARVPFRPIRDLAELREDLGARVMAGFGGVAEYGITVRWDKNFLKLIRLLLERRPEFKMFGGVRFGGTITIDSAFALGFDHIALCAGAGRPTIVPMKNGLASGVRQASDFLMALQLTGAGKTDSVANLQVRLPVVVIGGGLTAIDTATEALAYYPLQVEKFLARYEALVAECGEAAVRATWSAQEAEVAAEFLDHARQLRAERDRAAQEGRAPNFIGLLRRWGGATIVYRRRLIDAPSYTLNHEEVAKALEEGISFAEGLTPEEALLDEFGCVRGLRVSSASVNPTPSTNAVGSLPPCGGGVGRGVAASPELAAGPPPHPPPP
ncbi:MAG: FAD-dependent oxidoreductase, partial [Xanthobacteraceae bacterium]